MLIMNQDRNQLLNMDHFGKVFQAGTEILAENRLGDMESLGKYATPERAGEVLLEIGKKYAEWLKVEGGPCLTSDAYVQPLMFNPPKLFEMPSE